MDRPLAVVTRPVGVKVQRVHRVQRGRYRHWNRSAVQVQRVQKVQKVQKVQRGRYRPAGDEYVCCLAAAKTVQPGLRPVGNAPLFPYGDFPRRGKFALCPAFELISISKHSAAKTSPSGGGAVGRRGAFPRAIGAVVWFSLARKGGCKGFIHNGGAAAYQHPLNPLHLLNLLNPHARKGMSIKAPHHNPRAKGASNFRTLGAKAPSIFRTLTPPRACPLPYHSGFQGVTFTVQEGHTFWRKQVSQSGFLAWHTRLPCQMSQ